MINVEVDKIKKAGGVARLYRVADCAHARCNNQVCDTKFLPRNQSWDSYRGRAKPNKARPKTIVAWYQRNPSRSLVHPTHSKQADVRRCVCYKSQKSRLKLDFGSV